jgi:thioredoxin reductase
MSDYDVVVVGGGPAGLSAATGLARRGYRVQMIEQRSGVGGAIYRLPIHGIAPVRQSRAVARRWQNLHAAAQAAPISYRFSSVFLGVDGQGNTLIEDRGLGRVVALRASAVVIAVGAVEKVAPRLGWDLPGVSTAGGLQMMMKETGRAPAGRVLLAGNGPLLVAVATQMAALGNAPVAVVESGNPLGAAGLGLLPYPELLGDAFGYLAGMVRRQIAWKRGTTLDAIIPQGATLSARLRHENGITEVLSVDRIGLHDGIRPNNFGLPSDMAGLAHMPFITRAGDCREALGAIASALDGARAATEVADFLSRTVSDQSRLVSAITRQRQAQAMLGRVFAPVMPAPALAGLPDETVLCRCEQRRLFDLKAVLATDDPLSGREIKHNGRFSMGACQGRFCADNVARLASEVRPTSEPLLAAALTGNRWPIRPVSISALIQTDPPPNDELRDIQ